MKKLFKLILVFIPFAVFGQTATENYVKKTSYKVKTTNGTTKTTGGAITNEEKQTSITYFDGLGRAKQSVQLGSGGNKEDLIIHFAYDQFGRQIKEFLPYASGSYNSSIRTGSIENLGQQFYLGKFPNDFTGMTSTQVNSYSEKTLEKSPLNRILEQGAPGKDWKIGNTYAAKGYSNGSHTIKFEYDTNAANEVRLYSVLTTFANNTYTPTLQGGTTYYAAGELIKTITKDENWQSGQVNPKDHTTEEFKNKQGQVVLKRTYNNNIAHDTFYVYDDFGSLTYVIPPKAEGNLDKPTTTELNELCYQYKYDQRNRLVEKKIPGKGWEYIIYDHLDRPVITQDNNQRSQGDWLFTSYDQFGRVAYSGIVNRPSWSRGTMQNHVDTGSYNSNIQQYSSSVSINGVAIHYPKNFTNTTYIPESSIEILTINYYDTFVDLPTGFTAPTSVYSQGVTTNTKGLPTVSKVKVLGTSSWITTLTYYDQKGRAIYVYSKNDYLNITDVVESKLDDFTGKVLETKTTHTKSGNSPVITKDYFEYDHMDRVKKHSQNVNSANYNEVISECTYDNLGQLVVKNVGGKTNQNRLQNIDYSYNVRGWLKSINDVGTSNSSITLGISDLFGFEINYNNPSSGVALYNGNISQTFWKSTSLNPSGNMISNRYNYAYDALNRIKSGYDNTGRYDLWGIVYDKNGNITSLKRDGQLGSANSFGQMDNLTYLYDAGNKLLKVTDALSNDQYGFKDDALNNNTDSSNDYTYDVNGNMLTDQNKGITNISYNHLNLPTQVTLGGQNINYVYDASGVKLRKTVQGVTTDYAGNYIYENNTLQFFNHPEGYVKKDGSSFNYVYQYKDHLGNVRLSYTDKNQNNPNPVNIEIIEESNYYPFGLKHKGYNDAISPNGNSLAQKRKFGGFELQDELNLEWYDMTARNYDPALGRWMNLDPLAEQMRRHSPYNYAFNSPIYFMDPDGMAPVGCPDGEDCNDNTPKPVKYAQESLNPISLVSKFVKSVYNKINQQLDRVSGVAEVDAAITAGFNAKAKANIYGVVKADIKVNAVNFELASAKVDLKDVTNLESYTSETTFDGNGVKYSQGIGAIVDVAGKKIAGADISHSGRVHGNGKPATDKQVDGGVYLIAPIAQTASRKNQTSSMKAMSDVGMNRSPKPKLKAGSKNGTFYGLDLGVGAAFVLGVDLNLKLGVNIK